MFSTKECEILVAGLDVLARQQKDILQASMNLLPIRRKLDMMAQQASEKKPEAEPEQKEQE